MKKFLCALLIIVMLIQINPVIASGATGDAQNAYFQVGNSYHSTLTAALSEAQKEETATIYLLKDFTTSEKSLVIAADKTITLDLGTHTLTASNTGAYWIDSVQGSFTIKNGKIEVCRGIVVTDGGSLLLDNVDYTVTNTTSNARPAVKLSREGATSLTVKDSHLKTYGPGESLVLVEFATDGTINLEGETILEYAGVLDEDAHNCTAISVQQNWGANVDSNAETSNTDLVLNVGANAKIVNTAPSSANSDFVGSAISLQTKGNIELNFEKGATLEIDREAGQSKSYHLYETKYTGNVVINDKGANWLITAKALAAGNVHFTELRTDGDVILGWSDGEHLFKPGAVVAVANATKDASFSPVSYNKNDFQMMDGAAIRTIPGEFGIRFTTVVSEELVKKLGNTVTFGTIIYDGTTAYGNGQKIDRVVDTNKFVPTDNGKVLYYAAVFPDSTGDIKELCKRYYSAISYMTVKYSDGSTVTYNTDYNMNNTRSIATVAIGLDENGYKYDVVTDILNLFKGDATADDPPLLIGYGNYGSYYNGVFDSSGWFGAGMGYIIKTENGKLIVIDGGHAADAESFYNLMKLYSNTNEVVVDYWILTHPHSDHVGCLTALAAHETLSKKIDINHLVFHFPLDFDNATATYNKRLNEIATQYEANVINPKKGDLLNVDGAKITFLYVATNYSSFTTANQISLIFTVEINKKVMFTGDIYTDGLTAAYNEYGSALKCDILQMPHHFLCDTGYKQFYTAADASAVLLPSCVAGYNAMYNNPSYYNSTKHKANDFAAQNADSVYKAFEGTYEIEI